MPDWFRAQPAALSSRLAIPAGGMPALPPTPPPKPKSKPAVWAQARMPSEPKESMQSVAASVVMHHFSRGEIRTLNAGADALYARLVARLKTRAEFNGFSDERLREVIKNIMFKLQTAELTINFTAQSYFTTENDWTSYRQMYDLAQQNVTQADGSTKSEMRLTGNAMNDPQQRDAADTRVTFGAHTTKPEMQGIARFMKTGGLKPVGTNAAGNTEFAAYNTHFNPKARQQFAALNYGRRPHGGTQGYGACHFVLRDSLKENAIYYIGDTFTVQDTNSRVTYGMLFAVAVYGSDALLDDILNSCYRQMFLVDTDVSDRLVEAHIFEQISFARDIKEMRISQMDITSTTGKLLIEGKIEVKEMNELRETIKVNARKFATRNGIKLVWMD